MTHSTFFSSLNSKGLPLTLIDLLKGEFISAASLVNEPCDKTLAKWDKLSALLSGSEEDTSNRVVTQFLLNNYDAFEETANSSTKKARRCPSIKGFCLRSISKARII